MKTLLLALVITLCGIGARADTCVPFEAIPDTYSAAPGESWNVYATYTHCGEDGYLSIGSGFGSDSSLYATSELWDSFFFLAPGDSQNTLFATYTWTPDAPQGLAWNVEINSQFEIVATPCNGITVPCEFIGSPGVLWTDFTATVAPVATPVPEPGTLLLLGTGLVGIGAKLHRKAIDRRR